MSRAKDTRHSESHICPNCGAGCGRDSADVGVGIIYGPWGCYCGWSESEEYNQLTGPKVTEHGGVLDQYGILTPSRGNKKPAVSDDRAGPVVQAGDQPS